MHARSARLSPLLTLNRSGEEMIKNVGGLDKVLRIVVGVVLLSLVFVLKSGDSLWLWGLIGLVPLATGVMGNCPLYTLLGVNTCPRS